MRREGEKPPSGELSGADSVGSDNSVDACIALRESLTWRPGGESARVFDVARRA